MGPLGFAPRLVAVPGPTNTGKTHYAIERMLGHESGMIGFPLRLLARENYDRVAKIKGVSQVALITGEEKIAPPRPRHQRDHAAGSRHDPADSQSPAARHRRGGAAALLQAQLCRTEEGDPPA